MEPFMTDQSGTVCKARLQATVDFSTKAPKQSSFLKLNPRGQRAVAGRRRLGLLGLDRRPGVHREQARRGRWVPTDVKGTADVMQWVEPALYLALNI